MVKKIKFPLEMAEGAQARTIEELKEHFNLERILGYYLDGRLAKWLEDRYYDDEAAAVVELDKNAKDLTKRLADIFGIELGLTNEDVDIEAIEARNAKIAKLKQYTDDDEIIKNVDSVAFDQEELADLLDEGITKIYLCEGSFSIPKSKQDLEYIEVGHPIVTGKKEIEPPAKEQKPKNSKSEKVIRSNMPVCEYEGMYYYCDNGGIMRMNKDGSCAELFFATDHDNGSIAADGSCIYFTIGLWLRSIDVNSGKETKYDFRTREFVVKDGFIYYASSSSFTSGHGYNESLKKTEIGGTDSVTLATATEGNVAQPGRIRQLNIIDDDVYYVTDGRLYKFSISENKNTLLFDNYTNMYSQKNLDSIFIDGAHIYLMNGRFAGDMVDKLARVNLDGKDYKKIHRFVPALSPESNNLWVDDGFIYWFDEGKLFKQKIGNTDDKKRIIDTLYFQSYDYILCVINDSIFVKHSGDSNFADQNLWRYNLNDEE